MFYLEKDRERVETLERQVVGLQASRDELQSRLFAVLDHFGIDIRHGYTVFRDLSHRSAPLQTSCTCYRGKKIDKQKNCKVHGK